VDGTVICTVQLVDKWNINLKWNEAFVATSEILPQYLCGTTYDNNDKPQSGYSEFWPSFEPWNFHIRISIANQWSFTFGPLTYEPLCAFRRTSRSSAVRLCFLSECPGFTRVEDQLSQCIFISSVSYKILQHGNWSGSQPLHAQCCPNHYSLIVLKFYGV
jgi:hypothetical protein